MKKEIIPAGGSFLLYTTPDGRVKIETRMQGETVWLTTNQMAELFQIDKSGISRHLKNIYDSRELSRESTVAFFATVQTEGGREATRDLEYYNLDVIISVGYRVNSLRGTQFRIWATDRLREYIVKGFTLDDERLKQAGVGNYFDELLARIRDIRSSEKVFWRKVLEIYATSIDYSPNAEISQQFFRIIQNKMHWATHGHTAAEIVYDRADATMPREMGTDRERRQTIGRGLRLPVNQDGDRVYDEQINRLTVIANETFENFAKGLQSDIEFAIDPARMANSNFPVCRRLHSQPFSIPKALTI